MAAESSESGQAPSSRLCIKNVPKHVTEKRLREHFSAKGEVTDVKVLKTKDGQSRQMAFVGFRTAEAAAEALRYFNNSFLDTLKIGVEFARKVGDQDLARPWSRHSAGSSASQRQSSGLSGAAKALGPTLVDGAAAEKQAATAKGKKGKGKPEEEDPQLAEFMALMAPRSKAKIWANDDVGLGSGAGHKAAAAASQPSKPDAPDADGSDMEEDYQDLGNLNGGGGEDRDLNPGPVGARSSGAAGWFSTGSEDEEEEEEEKEEKEEKEEGQEEEGAEGTGREVVVNAGVSDLDYLRARMSKWRDSDEEEQEGDVAAARGDQRGVGTREASGGVAEGRMQRKGAGERKAAAAAAAAAKTGPAGKKGKARAAGEVEVVEGDNGGQGDGSEEEGDEERDGEAEEEGEGGEGGEDAMEGVEEEGERRDQGAKGATKEGPEVHEVEAGDEIRIIDTGRLFVRNLAYTTTEAELSELFGQYGNLTEVHLVLDRETKRSKGIAYVLYQVPEDAVKAHAELDMTIFQGRLLHILPAKKPPSRAAVEASLEAAAAEGFRAERKAQRKADAGNRSAWNTLFMRPDTVAEAVAAHYGVSKAELLDRGASDLPVRMALGEAHVVAQTKAALAEAGVDIAKLEAAAAASGKASATASVVRSPTTLLVKNLPYTAVEEELEEMFGKCGQVARLVLPPTRTLAIVEFTEAQDARSAFKAMAYKKYQHVPLYLEWAPRDVFTSPAPAPAPKPASQQPSTKQPRTEAGAAAAAAGAAATGKAASKQQRAASASVAADAAEEEEGGGIGGASVYVKNLAFATADAALKKHFDRAVSACGGSIRSAKVARKKGPDGAPLSMGFGFVEVDSDEVAKAVIKKLQGSMLDGHKLSLQLSRSKAAAADGSADKKGKKKKGGEEEGSTKLVCRNVAFEATRKDIAALFSPFGHLKSCRLPKKFDGSHRGFAFIEFVTKQEAKNAMEGVGGAHLYGRRLVVEYAQEDGGLDELRAKTAAKSRAGGPGAGDEDDALLGAAPGAKRLRRGL